MGKGSFKESDWASFKTAKKVDTATYAHDIYRSGSSSVASDWLPKNVTRESCDSEEHPNSTPIVIGLDVTGSMDRILTQVAKRIGDTMVEIIKRKCVTDPQILFSAIDDYITSYGKCIQVTQFESDIRIAKQMYDLSFIERGGGNNFESYADLWYFVKHHTKCDAIKKGRKGIVITVGDDGVQDYIKKKEILDVFGDKVQDDIQTDKLLSQLNRNWEVFHISLAEGSTYSDSVKRSWDRYLGERHIVLEDTDKLNEIIISLLQTVKGDSIDKIADSWDKSTAIAVRSALGNLSVNKNTSSDIVVF